MAARSTRLQTVFSAVRIFIWAVIAIALIKFAFFPDRPVDEAQSLNPSANYATLTVAPEKGEIKNTVKVKGTIAADTPEPAKATLDGTVSVVFANDGDTVTKGAPLAEIRKEVQNTNPPQAQQPSADGEEQPAAPARPEPTYEYATVYAPADGVLDINILTGQQFAIGDQIATVQPSTFSASAKLSAEQMYRISETPKTAKITIKDGPAPFDCTEVKIETPQGTTQNPGAKNQAPPSNDSPSGDGIQAKCKIPGEQKVFSGLQVDMELVAGEAKDALLLPISAVEGRFQTGYVYIPGDDPANPEKKQVKIGITDGKKVQILEGLAQGQEVLEYIPSPAQKKMEEERGAGEGGAPTPVEGGGAPEGAEVEKSGPDAEGGN
ncbi:MAG: efflux RND transporter periplasmic adaptor subunit [Actinomycetaceae bacterium]|nr:efflux RND transporter periplasmic adaptor subunit [Actinomycetaceae bacterium]